MIGDKKVIVFTPFGRELTASILYRYLKRDHEAGIVDEWHLWMNTDEHQVGDREYAASLDEDNDWIKRVVLAERPYHPKQLNTGLFYQFAQDEDAIYVRMDDDIVWIEPNAIKRLVSYRIANPAPFVVFPIIWNNAVCSHYLQLGGQLPSWWGTVSNYCMDPRGWADPSFAVSIHEHLLMCIDKDYIDQLFLHTSVQLPVGHQFSVSSFAQFGTEYAKVGGNLGDLSVIEEEGWHTISQPYALNRPNLIVPNALVSHFSFFHQREHLLQSGILEKYKELSENV